MYHHAYFDILLHTDDELCAVLGQTIASRETLQEWPLSCVQRVTLQDGTVIIYKAASGPTYEAEFYATARSPLLAPARILYRDENYACLAIAEIMGPTVERLALSEAEALHLARELLVAIAWIDGKPPVYLDLGEYAQFQDLMAHMLDNLHALVADGRYQAVNRADLAQVAQAVQHEAVRQVYAQAVPGETMGLVHRDLHSDNVFVLPDSYRIIDWQRPIYGPTQMDLVQLLTSLGFDPRPYVPAGVVIINHLLSIHWLVECSLKWFTPGMATYDLQIAALARGLK